MDTVFCDTLAEVFSVIKETELAQHVQFVTCAKDKNFGTEGKVIKLLIENLIVLLCVRLLCVMCKWEVHLLVFQYNVNC